MVAVVSFLIFRVGAAEVVGAAEDTLLVGVLAGAGAFVLENLLRAHRLPTRWVWAGTLALSLFWPLGHLLWRNWPQEAAPVPLPDPSRVAVLDPLMVQVAPKPRVAIE